jgi:L-asparaginase
MSHEIVYYEAMATAKKLKEILVIYTGGTFGMRPNLDKKGLELPQLKPAELKAWLNEQVPEMMKVARCDVDILFQLDSCQFGATHWFELASHILKKQANYDGVVILHGTDTLAYTASALSLLLSPTRIPVVLTGAQKPLATLRNDARQNFISALEVAAHAPKPLRNRVMVVFHDEVFLGSRIRKKSAIDFAAFESPRFSKLASIGSEIQYHEIIHQLPELKKQKPLLEQFRHSENELPQILRTELTPQFASHIFNQPVLQNLDGILLTLYTSGTAPTHQLQFVDFLKRAKESCTPILAITERENAAPSLKTYAAGRDLLELGVIWCGDLTPEAAFVKAWCLRELHSELTRKDYYSWIKKNWAVAVSDEINA